jgi:hypothetical protein
MEGHGAQQREDRASTPHRRISFPSSALR